MLGATGGYGAAITDSDTDGSTDDVLTFGSGLTINSTSAGSYLGYDPFETGIRAHRIVNKGTVNVLDNLLTIGSTSFSNQGTIAIADGASIAMSGVEQGIDNRGGTIRFAAGSNPVENGIRIDGGTIADEGAVLSIDNDTLSDVTYDGTMTLAYGYVAIAQGITLHGLDGSGDGAIRIGTGAASNASLVLNDTQTLDHGTITLGTALSAGTAITGFDTGGGIDDVLTFGNALTINTTSSSSYYYSFSHIGYDPFFTGSRARSVVNKGTINTLAGTLRLDSTSFANQGTITVAAGASLAAGDLADGLNNAGGTIHFLVGSDPLVNGSKINGGTIVDAGAALAVNSAVLNGVTYDGTLALAAGDLQIANGITLHALDGSGAGMITIGAANSSAALLLDDSQTLDNATVTLGAAGGYGAAVSGRDTDGNGNDILTLGSKLIVNAGTPDPYGTVIGYDPYRSGAQAQAIVNHGTINLLSGTLTIEPLVFTNEGLITVADGTTLNLFGTVRNDAGGSIRLSGGTLYTQNLSGTGKVTGFGTFTDYSSTDATTLAAADGTLVVASAAAGGTALIGTGATLRYLSTSAQAVTFNGNGATLQLDQPTSFTGTIGGLGDADAIDLVGVIATGPATFSGSILSIDTDHGTIALQLAAPANGSFAVRSDGANGTALVFTTSGQLFAQPRLDTANPVMLAPVRVGAVSDQLLSITNAAAPPAEALDVTTGSTTGAATAAGSISLLAAGVTDATHIRIGVDSSTPGLKTGSVTLALTSHGAVTTTLTSQTVAVTGAVYGEAQSQVVGLPNNLVVHVGDAPTGAITIANGAYDGGYAEALRVAVAGTTGAFSATAPATAIGAGTTGSVALGYSTAASGVLTGSVALDFTSDGTGVDNFAPDSLPGRTVDVSVAIDNYAQAALAKTGGAGILSGDAATGYTLDLGTVDLASGAVATSLAAFNAASGVADLLQGGFVVAGSAGFINEGFVNFSGLAAGGVDNLPGITFMPSATGMHSETITLYSIGTNASGYVGTLAPVTLNVAANVVSTRAIAAITDPGPIAFGNVRQGTLASRPLSVTNAAPAGNQSLDAAIDAGGLAGSATGSGAFSMLVPGGTDTSHLAVGIDTSTAGALTGSAAVSFASDDGHGATLVLPTQTIDVSATVFREAGYSFVSSTPIVHPGETAVSTVTVANSAATDGYSETLIGTLSDPSAGATIIRGATGNLSAGNSASLSLSFAAAAAAAGTLSQTATLGFQTDGTGIDGAGPTTLATQAVRFDAVVDNYATEALSASAGQLTSDGTNYVLNLGTVLEGGPALASNLFVTNAAEGPADLLSGSLVLQGGSGFANSTTDISFSDIAGGMSALLGSISLSSETVGTFSETFTLHGAGSNSSGYSGALADRTFTVTGTVAHRSAPDLVVSLVSPPAQTVSGQLTPVSWTITNRGDAAADGPWVDTVYLASDAGGSDASALGSFGFDGQLSAGESVTRTQLVLVPIEAAGTRRFIVRTDDTNTVQEYGGEANNQTAASTPTEIVPQPVANLVVRSVVAPTAAFSGQPSSVSWSVTNIGNGSTSAGRWSDQVYLSLDRTLDSSDVVLANISNPSYLAAGDSYSNHAEVTLPQGIAGPYYILVATDATSAVAEIGHEDDNVTASSSFPVTLSPSADLQVVNIVAPTQNFSGQPLALKWRVANLGVTATGADYWIDHVILSADGTLDSGDTALADVPHYGVLLAGAGYDASATIALPVGVSGDFTLFVTTDADKVVFESSDTNNDRGAATHINLTPPPDLVTAVDALPATIFDGEPVHLSYHVANEGSTPTPNSAWSDAIYLSRDDVASGDDQLLGMIDHRGALDPSQSYDTALDLTLPAGLNGAYHILVVSDGDRDVFELDTANNLAASTAFEVRRDPIDLVMGTVTAATDGIAGHQVTVGWQVTNGGIGIARGSWRDVVILSASGVLGAADNIIVGSANGPVQLDPGNSYTRSIAVDLPQAAAGRYTLFVTTDAGRLLADTSFANNTSPGAAVVVAPAPTKPDGEPIPPVPPGEPQANLVAAVAAAPSAGISGGSVTFEWTVTNTGAAAVTASSWNDKIYAVPANGGVAVALGTVVHTGALDAGASYAASGTFELPENLSSGSYRLFVVADGSAQVIESTDDDNKATSDAFPVAGVVPPVPNLQVGSVRAPATGISGQKLAVSWTESNTGDTAPGTWSDAVYLSLDQVFDASRDSYVGAFGHGSPLAAGASATFGTTIDIPSGLSGPFWLFVVGDADNALSEPVRADNIARSGLIQVSLAPPIDFAARVVDLPAAAAPGQQVTIGYAVDNLSTTSSAGSWQDAVYLSSDTQWDIHDALLGLVDHSGGVAGQGSYAASLTTTLPGVAAGSYHLIVRPDVRGAQPESDRSNDNGVSAGTIAIDVPTLVVDTPMTGSLASGGSAYYKLVVGAGETLKLGLTSDVAGSANDIYVAYGVVPTIGAFDATSATPLAQNATALITDTRAGTYYILVRANAVPGAAEHYALTAQTVPFGISAITPDSGSDLGSVTMTIDGAEFDANASVEIIGSDGTVHQAAKLYWVSGSRLWATFDLRGVPVGQYDVRVVDNGRTSNLADGFTVTSDPIGRLAVSLTAPSSLRTHVNLLGQQTTENGIVTVHYTNEGRTDVAVPILDLAISNAEFLNGTDGADASRVTVAGINQTGPAGILQPGAEASVSYAFRGDFGYAQFITMEASLGVLQADDSTAIDWTSLKEASRPAEIDSADWDLVWDRFVARVGTTTGSLVTALAGDATTFDQIGQTTSDVSTLIGYELQQAIGLPESQQLSSTVDLASSGAGFDVSLVRAYGGSLLRRNAAGAFGDGWTFTYDVKAIADASGDVTISGPGGQEKFIRGADGSFSGDAGVLLSRSGAGYVRRDAGGTSETFGADGKIIDVTDANGNSIIISYDTAGHIAAITGSDGQALSFTTSAQGRITTVVDGQGRRTDYTYDASGEHLLSASGPDGMTSYGYDAGGNAFARNALTSVTHPDGTHDLFSYDDLGRLAATSGDGGIGRIDYGYSGAGTISRTDASGAAVTLIYDADGHIAQTRDATGAATRLLYDESGRLAQVITADGGTYSYGYDAAGNLTSYIDPLGKSTSATYSAGGKLTGFTAQDGNTTHYGYDAAGNLAGITYADGSGTTYRYDPSGMLTGTTDARGQAIALGYDAQGNLVSKSFDDGTAETFAYDVRGNLTSATSRDGGTTVYGYDLADRLTSLTDANGRRETYAYDSGGREARRTEPDGSIVDYSYTTAGQLARLTDGTGALVVGYTYDAAGRLAGATTGNGATTGYGYDAAGNLEAIVTRDTAGNLTSRLDYDYDTSGRPVTVASLDGTWTYGYDATGQLTHAVFASINPAIASQDLSYLYDAAGNRVRTMFNGATSDYATNGLNQYISVDGTQYAYDADGNLVDKTQGASHWTYGYDEENQLVSVTGPDGNWVYGYDALGNRISSTRDGVRSDYVIDPQSFGLTATGPLASIAQVYDASDHATATYDYGNGLAAVTGAEGVAYYNADLTGNITSLSGAEGSLVQTYTYEPFGTVIGSTGELDNPFQFSGALGAITDASSLVNMRARDYDARLGRFITRDPFGLAGGLNGYAFTDNRPSGGSDPIGLFTLTKTYLGTVQTVGSATAIASIGSIASSILGGSVGIGLLAAVEAPALAAAAIYAIPIIAVAAALGVGVLIGYNTVDGLNNLYEGVTEGDGFTLGTSSDLIQGIISAIPFGEGLGKLGAGPLVQEVGGDALGEFFGGLGESAGNYLKKNTVPIHSTDPNDIVGPTGYGPAAYIAHSAQTAYTIDFENAVTASAPAQHIVITQQLDANLDWRSFRLTGFGFDNLTTALPGTSPFYTALLDYSAAKGYDVQVTAGVDVSTGIATWTFDTIDPATGVAPADPTVGLLPIDNPAGDGQGSVSYTIKPKSSDQSGDIVSAKASIVFDTNAAIDTPLIANTIDAAAPTSFVAALPAHTEDTTFEVEWGGSDDTLGSGIASYTVLVARDGATAAAWLTATTRTNALFSGETGHSYAFSVLATDNVGNVQAAASTPITIAVGAADRAPALAATARLTLTEDRASAVTPIGAVDADGDTLSYASKPGFGPAHGSVAYDQANGSLIYQPVADYDGADSFTVLVSDGRGGTAEQVVTVVVAPVNDAPVAAAAISLAIDEDGTSSPIPIGASDVDGDVLSYASKPGAGPQHGSVTYNQAAASFVYRAAADANGADAFTILISDGNGGAAEQAVTVTIQPVNDPAVISGQINGAVHEDSADYRRATGQLVATDVDGPAQPFSLTQQGQYGTLAITAAGLWTYDLDNGNPAVDALDDDSAPLVDTVLVQTGDGTTQAISIAIAGFSDTAVAGRIVLGTAGPDRLNGGPGNDRLDGGADNDQLNGGAGADVMLGGSGNDLYYVDDSGDVVTEDPDAGVDAVYASLSSYSLTDNVERLRFIGVGPFTGTGNGLDNVISGGDGADSLTGGGGNDQLSGGNGSDMLVGGADNDQLNGGAGADVMLGGSGNDLYYVDDSGDVVTEDPDAGVDAVYASLSSYSLTDNVERLRFIGAGPFTGTGNALDNVISGGDGADSLTGGGGNDQLSGGSGIDTAIYGGTVAGHLLRTTGGVVQLVDTVTVDGDDGTDSLSGIEQIRFGDGTTMSIASPIILDLSGQGIALTAVSRSNASFDFNGDGIADHTSWFSSGNGLLFLNRDENGTLSNAGELTFVNDGKDATSDLAGLAAFDSNSDGALSSLDAQFGSFRLFVDADGDGRVESGEVVTLNDAGVAAIALGGTATEAYWHWGDAAVVNTGSFVRTDGTSAALADVVFGYEPGHIGDTAVPARTASDDNPSFHRRWSDGRSPAFILPSLADDLAASVGATGSLGATLTTIRTARGEIAGSGEHIQLFARELIEASAAFATSSSAFDAGNDWQQRWEPQHTHSFARPAAAF